MNQFVELINIQDEQISLFKELMSAYLMELASYTDSLVPTEDGEYEYDGFELLFKKNSLLPFFITTNNKVVGFVILSKRPYVPEGIDYCVHELYVKPECRKNKIAKRAINKLFREYTGKYQVVQLVTNQPAIQFWRHVFLDMKIDYLESIKEVDGCKCYIQTFVS